MSRQVAFDDYDLEQLQAVLACERQMQALRDHPADFNVKQYDALERERNGILLWFAHSVIKALDIKPAAQGGES